MFVSPLMNVADTSTRLARSNPSTALTTNCLHHKTRGMRLLCVSVPCWYGDCPKDSSLRLSIHRDSECLLGPEPERVCGQPLFGIRQSYQSEQRGNGLLRNRLEVEDEKHSSSPGSSTGNRNRARAGPTAISISGSRPRFWLCTAADALARRSAGIQQGIREVAGREP